jgi:trans-aconitate methyltransferase
MNAATNADMIEYWNGDVGQKWVRFQDLMDRSFLPLGHAAMDAAAPKTGERVIDVGCGCGDTTFDLAHRVGPKGHVLGVDISIPMLTRAKDERHLRARRCPGLRISEACLRHRLLALRRDVLR